MITCPKCRGDIIPAAERVVCAACGAIYPAPFGVPILVSGAQIAEVEAPTEETVGEVSKAIGAERAVDAVRRCLSISVRMPDLSMQVEADQFVNRLRATGLVSAAAPKHADTSPANVVADVGAVILAPIMLPEFVAGQHHTFNVRVTNTGRCTLSSTAQPPFFLSYRWRSAFGTVTEGRRTTLLVDLLPGRSITVPLQVEAPPSVGTYTLELVPLFEFVTWLDASAVTLQVEVHDQGQPTRFTHDTSRPPLSYSEDHVYGARLLGEWLSHYTQGDAIILEIGGNLCPLIAEVEARQRFNLDVDAHALMARNISRPDGIFSLVGDGFALPFRDRSLDAIVMAATFHHFANPVGFLAQLRDKLRSNGVVVLLCEPIGHVIATHRLHNPLYFHELESGVNEQSFEVWEYEAFARAAGFEILEARFESGSAKIALRST